MGSAQGHQVVEQADVNDFWRAFHRDNWEKRPGVFHGAFSDPANAACDIVPALKAAASAWRAGESTNFGIWINGRRPELEYQRFFIADGDTTVEDYVDRIIAEPDVDELCFTHFNLQSYSPMLWFRARDFLHGLLPLTGLPMDEIDLDIFTGRYARTPGGIHTDAASTFMCVLQGTKRMYVWPADYFDDKDVAIAGEGAVRTIVDSDYGAFMDDATELVGGPGDVLYWPSTAWHISVPNVSDAFSLVLNIGLFFSQKPAPMFGSVFDELVGSYFDDRFQWGDTYTFSREQAQQMATGLPGQEAEAARLLSAPGIGEMVEHAMAERWLQRVSAGGFRRIPPRSRVPEDAEEISVNPRFPILYRATGEHLTVAANGHLLQAPNTAAHLAAIALLNDGGIHEIPDLAEKCATSGDFVDAAALRNFLIDLKSCHL
ncbi:hypothetical protein [Roseibium alexandrii]|uniref:JmjC domain-containing protein n=1 Tax=Roseibium alexandrii (strain DSM 17067 / NCIMB 14079 / DFL-11) TaxID=244592 RepID=A0A5E8GX96_ROSAD|nr:hypothetical protein [Roseibium alexandrii]EEE44627.1 hypothetical protein SADFL11_1915 [Roseibium alexandrii DFL-11]